MFPPPPLPKDIEERRAYLIDLCREISQRYQAAAEAEMKPYLDMLAMLPSPTVVVTAEMAAILAHAPKDK